MLLLIIVYMCLLSFLWLAGHDGGNYLLLQYIGMCGRDEIYFVVYFIIIIIIYGYISKYI